MKNQAKMQFTTILLATIVFAVGAQSVSPGYVLYCPVQGSTAFLVDTKGDTVHSWRKLTQGNSFSCHLLPNGNILRPTTKKQDMNFGGVVSDCIQEIDPSGKVVWEFNYKTDSVSLHHNICPMPNGHILAVAYEKKTIQTAKDSGITNLPSQGFGGDQGILTESFIEIDPSKPAGQEIVWRWRMWDHLVKPDKAALNPQLFSVDLGVDTDFASNDWVHLNGYDYNEKLDQIVFTSRIFSELFIIDHSTTTAEAAGHTGGKCGKGGDIIYRWGRPSNYKTAGTVFIHVAHCPLWVPEGYPGAGHITLFSNQIDKTSSAVLELNTPLQSNGLYDLAPNSVCAPLQPFWSYSPADSFSSDYMSSAQRQPNGNTLICLANTGAMREVTQSGTIVWRYQAISGTSGGGGFGGGFGGTSVMVARALKYAPEYPGIAVLLGGSGVKLSAVKYKSEASVIGYKSGVIEISGVAGSVGQIYTMQGKKILSLKTTDGHLKIDTAQFRNGAYIVKVVLSGGRTIAKQISIM